MTTATIVLLTGVLMARHQSRHGYQSHGLQPLRQTQGQLLATVCLVLVLVHPQQRRWPVVRPEHIVFYHSDVWRWVVQFSYLSALQTFNIATSGWVKVHYSVTLHEVDTHTTLADFRDITIAIANVLDACLHLTWESKLSNIYIHVSARLAFAANFH